MDPQQTLPMHGHTMKYSLLPNYVMPPSVAYPTNIISQHRDGSMETTTWRALVAQS